MSPKLKQFIQRWVISTVAVLVATMVLRGRIDYGSPLDLIVATLVLGLLNGFVRPVLMLLSLPLLIFTLGLFTLVINALLLLLVSAILGPHHFHVDGFWSAFWGAVIISIISLVLNSLTGSGDARIRVHRGRRPEAQRPQPPKDDGNGPVIDV